MRVGVFFVFLGLVWWVFGDVVKFRPLLYDDPEYLNGRPDGWGLGYWRNLGGQAVVNLWHPLTVHSHDLVSRLGGDLEWRHHLANVVLHLAAGAALVHWLRGVGWSFARAGLVALIWLFHPCLVESVAWVSGRKDILCALFVFLALGGASRGRATWVVFVFCIGALLSKPVAIVLPVVLVVQDLALRKMSVWSFLKWERSEWTRLLRRYGMAAVAAFLVVIVTLTFQSEGGQATEDPRGAIERVSAVGWALLGAVRLWLYPVGLHTAYDDPVVLSVWFAFFAILILGAVIWAIGSARVNEMVRISLAVFILFLLPTLGFVRAGNHLVADRYLYLSGVGLTLLVISGLSFLKRGQWIVGVLLVLFLSGLTRRQRGHWVNTRAVFERVVDLKPEHSYGLAKIGTLERIEGRFDSARSYYNASLKIDSRSPDARKNLAEMALENEDYEGAYAHYLVLAETWGREAWLHERVAKLASNLGHREEALKHVKEALRWASGEQELASLRKLEEELKDR